MENSEFEKQSYPQESEDLGENLEPLINLTQDTDISSVTHQEETRNPRKISINEAVLHWKDSGVGLR